MTILFLNLFALTLFNVYTTRQPYGTWYNSSANFNDGLIYTPSHLKTKSGGDFQEGSWMQSLFWVFLPPFCFLQYNVAKFLYDMALLSHTLYVLQSSLNMSLVKNILFCKCALILGGGWSARGPGWVRQAGRDHEAADGGAVVDADEPPEAPARLCPGAGALLRGQPQDHAGIAAGAGKVSRHKTHGSLISLIRARLHYVMKPCDIGHMAVWSLLIVG